MARTRLRPPNQPLRVLAAGDLVDFEDIEMCQAMTPMLTSVRIDRDQLGRVAVDMIRTLVEEGPAPSRRLPVELVVRASAP